MADINIKRNDREPSVSAILRSGTTPLDLTGATVKFIMKARGSAVAKVNASAAVVSPTVGSVRYDWAAGDTDTAGQYDAEFQVTTASTHKYTFPNAKHLEVLVFEDLGD